MRNKINTPHPALTAQTSMPAHRVQAFSPVEKTNAKGVVENSQSCEFFPTRGEVMMLEKSPLKIKELISETVNYGHNAAVFFDVELKDGSLERINIVQLFSDREFLASC